MIVVLEVNGGFVEDRIFVFDGMFFIVFKYGKMVDIFKYFDFFKKFKRVVVMKINV